MEYALLISATLNGMQRFSKNSTHLCTGWASCLCIIIKGCMVWYI